MVKNLYCQKCGEKLVNLDATHCSEKCLFEDIKKVNLLSGMTENPDPLLTAV